ncbi:hypothetical protein M3Y99_00609600 [Aphelenchoides fujianensis]|nr:hypothetical protein M3Y99_00609600 [Aphelenchoides fujianensis]
MTPIINLLMGERPNMPAVSESIDEQPSSVNNPHSILRSFRLFPSAQPPTTTTTTTQRPPDLVEEILRPFFEPFRRDLEQIKPINFFPQRQEIRRAPVHVRPSTAAPPVAVNPANSLTTLTRSHRLELEA